MSFKDRYGPWALIAGASEGTGRAFARRAASEGLNCVLIARRQAPLDELAAEIRKEFGVECVTGSVDLAKPDASERVIEIIGGREIGLYVSNAGSDPNGARFLDRDVQVWVDLLARNAMTTLRSCHALGAKMRERKRGGLLLVGSGACYGGGSFMATYSGSKAFEMCFAEGLWAELKPHNVDVLYFALNTTDTPELRRLLNEKGLPPPPGLAAPDDVARVGFENLANGPIRNWGFENNQAGMSASSPDQRRERILMIDQASKRIFGDD